MSSTNVHSEKQNNKYCAVAQIVPTDKEVEIPPKTAKKGPSVLDVMLGEAMEIPVVSSELHKDGKLIDKDGAVVAKFSKDSFEVLATKNTSKSKQIKDEAR